MVVNSLVKLGFPYSGEFPTFFVFMTVTSVLVCVGLVIKLSKVNPNVLKRVTSSFSPTTSKLLLPSTLSAMYETGSPTFCAHQLPAERSSNLSADKHFVHFVETKDVRVALNKPTALPAKKSLDEPGSNSPHENRTSQAAPSNETKPEKEKASDTESPKPKPKPNHTLIANPKELNSTRLEKAPTDPLSSEAKSNPRPGKTNDPVPAPDTSQASLLDDKDFIAIEKRRRRKNKKSKAQAQHVPPAENKANIPKQDKQIRRRQKSSSTESSPHPSPTNSPKVVKLVLHKRSPDGQPRADICGPRVAPTNSTNVPTVPNPRHSHSAEPAPRATFINMGYDYQQWYSPFSSGFHVDIFDRELGRKQQPRLPTHLTSSYHSVVKKSPMASHGDGVLGDTHSRYIPQGRQFSLFERGF
ncbi:hypothetical protein K493DRAFT_342817 [Basidiobolus meristosporus CBS 931.73]|uniref:Uncharacterized protein n=1 Tax=Basidiobolus meristosporus CBS 931.73 TaxID=1314790 RepID=A0A1Y1WYT9_9FUNG|nr:hypothetical protein K493DRAFT_342817 [Basidiobolus meristosporus CBS 931.73]|eukprot:ORX78264.1 hypothetical protein K493DRAFT_342817 [Basidiobolus meristosporus CBS 931.73]